MQMLVGTYTRNTGSEGVYAWRVEPGWTRFTATAVNREIDNPSWIVRHPRLDVVYSVNEVKAGAISAFACDEEGRLTLLNRVASRGADPCHLALHPAGTALFVSNYSSGNLAGFALGDGGELGEMRSLVQHSGRGVDPLRQSGAHAHSMVLDPGGEFAWACDLGLDQVVRYAIGESGEIDATSAVVTAVRPGAGPRLLCFDSTGRFVYVINELDNTLVAAERNADGHFVELEVCSTLPDDFGDTSYCAHIAMSRDGRFLYASNRGHDSIAVFRVTEDGVPALVQWQSTLGRHPRHFSLTPDESHLLVANRDSDNIVVMARNRESGELTPTGTVLGVPAPVCVLF